MDANHIQLGQITTWGRVRQTNPVPARGFRRLGTWALLFLRAGEGWYSDEQGRELSLSEGDALMLSPTVGHRYGPTPETAWIEQYIVFQGPICRLWEESGLLHHDQPLRHHRDIEIWASQFERAVKAADANQAMSELGVLLCLIRDQAPAPPVALGDDASWLARAELLLQANLNDEARPDLEEVANDLAMTYDGFRKRFRRLTGKSPGRYRAEHTISRAQDLIRSGFLTDREIADRLGFVDEHHFSRRFRALVGKSPSAWRAEQGIRTSS